MSDDFADASFDDEPLDAVFDEPVDATFDEPVDEPLPAIASAPVRHPRDDVPLVTDDEIDWDFRR